jgi:hypothetical protein
MREKLNENPMAQVGLIAILAVVGVVLFISSSGGGEEEEVAAPTEATVAVAGTGAVATATGATPGEAVEGAVESVLESPAAASASVAPSSVPVPPPPARLAKAYDSGKTVVLMIVHRGGIDDALVERTSSTLAAVPGVALFVVPDKQIARYAAITVSLEVNRVPALVVMKPKQLSDGTPQASVDYGIQTSQSALQAVRDATYNGREVTYHPN